MENEHAVHILPVKLYLIIGSALLVLTAITVFSASIDLGFFNIIIALGIASLKASLVALFFMHLYFDNKLYGFILAAALFFLTSLIALTLIDTMRRGDLYEYLQRPVIEDARIYNTPTDGQTPPAEQH